MRLAATYPGLSPTRTPHFRLSRSLFALLLVFALLQAARAQQTIHIPADYGTIQAGLNNAVDGDTVIVSPGIYYEHLDFAGKAVTLVSSAGAASTTLDGGLSGPVVTIGTDSNTPAVLDGFTVQNGTPPVSSKITTSGGITIAGSATVQNSTVQNNHSCGIDIAAPGIDLIHNNHILANGLIIAPLNASGCASDGSGIESSSLSSSIALPVVTISGNLIEGNAGGGIAGVFELQTVLIVGNTIRNGLTGSAGISGVSHSANATVANNLVYNNALDISLSFYSPSTLSLTNNTIYGDRDSELDLVGAGVVVTNNIVFRPLPTTTNTPMIQCGQDPGSPLPPVFDHNDFYNATTSPTNAGCPITGFGNIAVDPRFTNPGSDFHLLISSPAIDAGNDSAPNLPAADFDGNPRIADATGKGYPIIDLGAYEVPGNLTPAPTVATLVPSTSAALICNTFNLTASLTSPLGIPSGSVSLFEDQASTPVGTATLDATGTAVFSISTLTAGIHGFYVTYAGAPPFTPAEAVVVYINSVGTGTCTATTSATLTASPNPGKDTLPVQLTATLTSNGGIPTGSVTFTEGVKNYGSAPLNAQGVATLTISSLLDGSHTLTAGYPPTGTFSAVSASTQIIITGTNPSNVTLVASANPTPYGQRVIVTANLVSANVVLAQGVLTLTDGVTVLASENIVFAANPPALTFTSSTLGLGTHHLVATFTASSPDVSGSSAALDLVVTGSSAGITFKASPTSAYVGQTVTLNAAIVLSGTTPATGTVTFLDGSATLATVNLDPTGQATYNAVFTSAATHTLYAAYSGNTSYPPIFSAPITETIQINPTSTTFTSSADPAVANQNFTITAHVNSLTSVPVSAQPCFPNCVLSVSVSGLPPGASLPASYPVLANGTVSINLSLPAGTYTFSAQFQGSAAFAPSTANPFQETVTAGGTTVTLTGPTVAGIGRPVALAAALTLSASGQIPTGTVTFLDSGVPIGSAAIGATVAGKTVAAGFSINTLALGAHTITASYPGNGTFAPAVSAPLVVTIVSSDFLIAPPAPVNVQTEHHVTTTLTFSSVGEFADTLRLSCNNPPADVTCTFTPAGAVLTADGTTTVSLYLDTDAVIGYARLHPLTPTKTSPITFALLLSPATLLLLLRRGVRKQGARRSLMLCVIIFATAPALSLLNGCSGKYPASTPPGVYTISVVASAYNTPTTHTAPLTLNVTP